MNLEWKEHKWKQKITKEGSDRRGRKQKTEGRRQYIQQDREDSKENSYKFFFKYNQFSFKSISVLYYFTLMIYVFDL